MASIIALSKLCHIVPAAVAGSSYLVPFHFGLSVGYYRYSAPALVPTCLVELCHIAAVYPKPPTLEGTYQSSIKRA